MFPRDGLSSEAEIIVTDGFQTILFPGAILGTCSSPLIQILTSTLHDPPTEPLPAPPTADVHALHDNILVANDGLPSLLPIPFYAKITLPQAPRTPE